MIRISSQQIFTGGINRLQDLNVNLNQTQEQVSTGKRVNRPSDDPVAAARILKLDQEVGRIETYQRKVGLAENRLQLEESSLDSMVDIIQRVRDAERDSIFDEYKGRKGELMSGVDDGMAIKFSPEDVKYTVSIFTDIDCSYCRRLHSQIDEYLEHGIEVRYFLYPRGGPASRSWNTSEDVWCSKDRGDALTQAKLDRDFETSNCDASAVSDHYIMGQEVGLSGTPAIVLDDGELIGGYLPPDALRMRLEQKTAVE